MPINNFSFKAGDGKDMAEELSAFANWIGLERAAPGRYSVLLLLELFGMHKSRQQNTAKIIHEIEVLEGLFSKESSLKPPAQFRGPFLKGLWHKHYLPDGLSTFAKNIENGLNKYGLPLLEQRIKEAEEAGEEKYFTPEEMNLVADEAVIGTWMRRTHANELTGEWIIYARPLDKNYYLCLGRHDSGDEFLRHRIEAVCCSEFSFLTEHLCKKCGT